MEDRNNGGQSYISVNVTRTNLLSSKSSGRFTLMVLTVANSGPVLCICILAATSLIVADVKGFYYRASIPYDSSKTKEENMEEFKALPGLPVSKFRGGFISGLMCMSSKVSIRSEILTDTLKYLDHINVSERRQDGPNLFGLLDCHGSRLQLLFLE